MHGKAGVCTETKAVFAVHPKTLFTLKHHSNNTEVSARLLVSRQLIKLIQDSTLAASCMYYRYSVGGEKAHSLQLVLTECIV